MAWQLRIAKQAQKNLANVPRKDRERILKAVSEMRENPFKGDIVHLKGEPNAWRRRVGNYRIFFDLNVEELLVDVTDIRRRTTTTY